MKTIFYLIDVPGGLVIKSFEGRDNKPPVVAFNAAKRYVKAVGCACALARGIYFFQPEYCASNIKVREATQLEH